MAITTRRQKDPTAASSTTRPDKAPTTTWTSTWTTRAAGSSCRIVAGDDDGIDPETARRIRYAIRLTPDRGPDRVFANIRRNGVDAMLDRYVD